MSESKIIQFPKNKSTRVLSRRKAESRQVLSFLSLVSLVLTALYFHDHVASQNRPVYVISDNNSSNSYGRGLASFDMNDSLRDLDWEKSLAQRLSADEPFGRVPASFGRPSQGLDEIRFGALAGKYRIVSDAKEKIVSLRYTENLETADRPEFIEREQFLRHYKNKMSIAYTKFELVPSSQPGGEEYRLIGDEGEPVGHAIFKMDGDGRFISLDLRRN